MRVSAQREMHRFLPFADWIYVYTHARARAREQELIRVCYINTIYIHIPPFVFPQRSIVRFYAIFCRPGRNRPIDSSPSASGKSLKRFFPSLEIHCVPTCTTRRQQLSIANANWYLTGANVSKHLSILSRTVFYTMGNI